jgi:ArsR family transcriptional regulator, arsenate/arsenite/antimonite-responsive transcriptional repressor
MKSEKSQEKLFDMELFFAALADNTRLRLLNLMRDTEVCVCFFVEVIGTNQPKISRHLAYLRKAGIVAARRDGIWAHYRIVEPKNENAAKVLHEVQEWLRTDKTMQKDRKQLANVCCAPQPPVSIQGAPRPKLVSV